MQSQTRTDLAPPPRRLLAQELISPVYMASAVPLLLRGAKGALPRTDARPVTTLPGIFATDMSMGPLRILLRRQGYDAQGWGRGRNLAGRGMMQSLHELSPSWEVDRDRPHKGEGEVPYLCDLVTAQIRERAERLERPIALVGWSLGGYIAREVARDLPEHVDQIVTLGAPVVGGPKYTRAAKLYKKRDFDLDWLDAQTIARHKMPITQPLTVIYSRRDGIVGWQAARDPYTPQAEHIEIACAHNALALNGTALRHVMRALGQV